MAELFIGSTCWVEAELFTDLWFCHHAAASPSSANSSLSGTEVPVSQIFTSTTVPQQRPLVTQAPLCPMISTHLSTALDICRSFPPPQSVQDPLVCPSSSTSPTLPLRSLPWVEHSCSWIFVPSSCSMGSLWPPMTSSLHPLCPSYISSLLRLKKRYSLFGGLLWLSLSTIPRLPTPLGLHCPHQSPKPLQKEMSTRVTCWDQRLPSHLPMTSWRRCLKWRSKCCSVVEPKSQEELTPSYPSLFSQHSWYSQAWHHLSRQLRSRTGREDTWAPVQA